MNKLETIDEYCNQPAGSFKQFVKDQEEKSMYKSKAVPDITKREVISAIQKCREIHTQIYDNYKSEIEQYKLPI